MTKIAYVADVHVGNHRKWGGRTVAGVNERAALVLDTLDRAVALAESLGCDAMGVAGDLFDYVNIEPQLVARTQQILRLPTFAIPGNHDICSVEPDDNALAPLQDHLTLVQCPTVLDVGDTDVLCVPFEPGPPIQWLGSRIESVASDRRPNAVTHLMVHMGVSNSDVPYFLDSSSGSIKLADLQALMEEHDIEWALAGDWHRHKAWPGNRSVVQVGCLAPKRFPPGEHEHSHCGPMVVVDAADYSVFDIPGPRFVSVDYGSTIREFSDDCTVFIKMFCSEDDEAEAKKLLKELVLSGSVKDVECVVDRVRDRAAARTAAYSARSASSVDEALRAYVDTMSMPDSLDRTDVLQRIRRYL